MKYTFLCSFFILFFLNIWFTIATVFSYELVQSVEVRQFILQKIYQGDMFENYTHINYMQNDGKIFSIVVDESKQTIDIIPERYGSFIAKNRASWSIKTNSDESIEYIRVYIQDNTESYVSFTPFLYATRVSVVLNAIPVFNEISVPLSFQQVFQLPFEDIVRTTRSVIEWDWLFANEDNFELYANNQNFAAFMQQNFVLKDYDSVEYLSFENKIVQWYCFALVDFINKVLSFMNETTLSVQQFYPLENNRRRISFAEHDFIYRYTKNITEYLYTFVGLQAKFEQVVPKHISFEGSLEQLESQLYMWTIRYPSFFYLVLIDEIQSKEDNSTQKTVAWRVYIPYITPAGDFDYYQSEFDTIEAMELQTDSPNYQYRYSVIPIRVPFSYEHNF